jgi:ketosteroid isomerase-like protein
MTGPEHDELIRLAHAWDRAMVENDAEAIGSFMADDWVIADPTETSATGRPFWLW